MQVALMESTGREQCSNNEMDGNGESAGSPSIRHDKQCMHRAVLSGGNTSHQTGYTRAHYMQFLSAAYYTGHDQLTESECRRAERTNGQETQPCIPLPPCATNRDRQTRAIIRQV
jgi:hypothetical protein